MSRRSKGKIKGKIKGKAQDKCVVSDDVHDAFPRLRFGPEKRI